MSPRWRAFFFSFQTKLVLAMALVIVLAILLAGTVFVVRTRDERREQALDRVAAASPAIYQQAFLALLPDGPGEATFAETLDALAEDQDVRILILGPQDVVLYDTGDRLGGQTLVVPRSRFSDLRRGFVAWQPDESFPERDVTFVSASSRVVVTGVGELPFRIVLAVETDTIASAWLGVLPGLLLAALVAVPLSSLAAILLARQVAQPVRRLTRASEAVARGDFSQRVESGRDDEVGRLARSFSSMAERVGERETQMRALLANVSHDLKTPMTSITGYAHSLTDGTASSDDAARIGAIIRDEAHHVNSLLADLLFLGEIDAGQLLMRAENVQLAPLVARSVRRTETQAQERGVAVEVDVPDELTLTHVDAEKVERALTNVLDNAVKFSPRGGSVEVRAASSPAGTVACEISNEGAPISEDDLPRIFDRFFRGDRARRTSGGSGLGLAISRQLVELNGGRIEALNGDGRVTFRLTLPGGRQPASEPKKAAAAS